MVDTLIYFPSQEDKIIINALNNHIIDTLSPLNIPQKAFALHCLIHSFEDVSGIKATAIIDDNNFSDASSEKNDG